MRGRGRHKRKEKVFTDYRSMRGERGAETTLVAAPSIRMRGGFYTTSPLNPAVGNTRHSLPKIKRRIDY